MLISLTVAIVTVALFLASVLFFPSIGKIKIYSWIPFVGGILTVILGELSFSEVLACFVENSSVNPIKILVLFLLALQY